MGQTIKERDKTIKEKDSEINRMAKDASDYLERITRLETKLKNKNTDGKKTKKNQKKTYAPRTNKIPEVLDMQPDNRPRQEPEFTSYEKKGKIVYPASLIAGIHNKCDRNNLCDDRQFVYMMLKKIFNRVELQTMTLTGSKIMDDKNKVVARKNVLDKSRISYAYRQYVIRGNAIGINDDHRTARTEMKYFKIYVAGLTKSSRTYFLQQQKNKTARGGNPEKSSSDDETETEDEPVPEGAHKSNLSSSNSDTADDSDE